MAMRLLLYESITAGGAGSPTGSLLIEGRAMAASLAADLAAAGHQVAALLADRLDDFYPRTVEVARVADPAAHDATLDRLAAENDAALLIAPETGGALYELARRVEALGATLLSPSAELIALAGDKQATCRHLAAAGLPVPPGAILPPGGVLPTGAEFPLVAKPLDGAGSQGVRLLASAEDRLPPADVARRLEVYCPGTPASVTALCGRWGHLLLPATRQRLSDDGRCRYLGGAYPLSAALARRGAELARRAVETLPEPVGYLGIDLVLGPATDGRDDVVIEINPRLTTSYVGLRAAARGNLAAAMLATVAGLPAALSFGRQPLEFEPDGTVHHAA